MKPISIDSTKLMGFRVASDTSDCTPATISAKIGDGKTPTRSISVDFDPDVVGSEVDLDVK